jgi:uncharacterized membrane protein YedE/YeeE
MRGITSRDRCDFVDQYRPDCRRVSGDELAGTADPQVANLQPISWLVIIVAGLVLGYSSRTAFGCKVGAFFSGLSTGSLHGWVWFVAAFAGSSLGIRRRPIRLQQAHPVMGVGIP